MTAAVIYIDPLAIHPVIDGEWHRTRLAEIPQPGQAITMLCDAVCRREQGIPPQQDRLGRR